MFTDFEPGDKIIEPWGTYIVRVLVEGRELKKGAPRKSWDADDYVPLTIIYVDGDKLETVILAGGNTTLIVPVVEFKPSADAVVMRDGRQVYPPLEIRPHPLPVDHKADANMDTFLANKYKARTSRKIGPSKKQPE